jgi:hypothetical protein
VKEILGERREFQSERFTHYRWGSRIHGPHRELCLSWHHGAFPTSLGECFYFRYSVGSGPFSNVVRSQIHPWRV